jgi:hypothetical protein
MQSVKIKTGVNHMSETKKDCMSCLYCGTHEKCHIDNIDCLGNRKEQEKNNGEYLYSNYQVATEKEIFDRVYEFEKTGKRNIVIGGTGEAEVNVNNTPEETLENLCNVAEECGYFVTKGKWENHHKEINVMTDSHYVLTYWHNKLESIDRIISKRWWTA